MESGRSNQEVDVRKFFSMLYAKLWLLILLTVLGAAIAFGTSMYVVEPVYRAESTLFIGKDAASPMDLEALQLKERLITDIREMIKLRLVASEVRQTLSLNRDLEKIQKSVGIAALEDSSLFSVTYEDTDPVLAAQVVNAFAEVVIKKSNELMSIQNVQVLDPAVTPAAPVRPLTWQNMAIGGCAGLLLSLIIIYLIALFDPRIQKSDELEERFGIKVLGTVPEIKAER